MEKLHAIILAGGQGTRLWPLSRRRVPKQIQPILGEDTLLKTTWKRLRGGLPASRILVVAGAEHAPVVRRDLPELPDGNLLVEPVRRNTAAAIGLGAQVVRTREPDAVVVTVNSDAYVRDEAGYFRALRRAAEAAAEEPKRLTLVGIRPTYAETGYGYIKTGALAGDELYEVEGFREKPDLKTAMDYVMQKEYLWNPTLIVADAEALMEAFRAHLPEMHEELERVRAAWGSPEAPAVLADAFERMTPISIDYGILELEKGMRVIPADFGWADVGHWRAVHDVLAANPKSNVSRTPHVNVDSRGNLLYSYSGKLIATAGVENMIIVETEDVILACPKDRAQDVRKLVSELEKKNMEKYL